MVLAAISVPLATPAGPSSAIPMSIDANRRCVSDNFARTKALLARRSSGLVAMQAELGMPAPHWVKLRRLIVDVRTSDMLLREEIYRVELMCLDKISESERISSLRSEFGKADPPLISIEERLYLMSAFHPLLTLAPPRVG